MSVCTYKLFPSLSPSPPLSLSLSLSLPRWASTGLDFLTLACAPRQLALMSSTTFEYLKKLMNRSLDHVVGEAPPIQGYDTKFSQSPSVPHRPAQRRHKYRQPPLLSAVSLPQNLSEKMENVVEEEWEGEAPLESTPARGGYTKGTCIQVTFSMTSTVQVHVHVYTCTCLLKVATYIVHVVHVCTHMLELPWTGLGCRHVDSGMEWRQCGMEWRLCGMKWRQSGME